MSTRKLFVTLLVFLLPAYTYGQIYEISGSADATENAPLPEYIKAPAEKLVVVDPTEHVWGAYNPKGKLIRWGIATTGAEYCSDIKQACHTKSGHFRIYSLGDGGCISSKYPIPGGGAAMPYCMYFNGSQALHGSDDVEYRNASHGCVRIHVEDAKWLRYQFAEGPTSSNNYKGTKVWIKEYKTQD